MPRRSGTTTLWRGASAAASAGELPARGVREVEIARIRPNPAQPRMQFDEEAIAELAESIAERGVLQPVLLRPDGNNFQLVAGERRWRFPVSAGRHEIALHTAPFVPGPSNNGRDRRSLGVLVRAVRLLDGDVPRLGSQSPAADYRSKLGVRPTALNPHDQTRAATSYRVDVDNVGRAEWPAATDVGAGVPAVSLGFYLTQDGDARRLAEQRIALPYSLRPGEHWTTALIVDATAESLRALPAGDYLLHVGLVFDGVAWFADRGERDVTMPLTIAPR